MNNVLYLNGRIAVWVRIDRGLAVNVHVESAVVEQAEYRPCHWLTDNKKLVHVILDTEQVTIDAHALQCTGSHLAHRSNRKALVRKLIDQYPESIINVPDNGKGLDALFVQQVNLPETTRQWLAYVEKSALVFCSYTTGSELLADLFVAKNDACIVVSNLMGYQKHTFCRGGIALFSRTFEQANADSLCAGLEETLTHLYENELIDQPLIIYSIGFSRDKMASVKQLAWVSDVECFEDRKCVQRQAIWKRKCESQSYVDDMAQYCSAIDLAKHAINRASLRDDNASRHCTFVCSKHLRISRHRHSKMRVAVTASLACLAVGISGVKEVRLQRAQKEFTQAKNALISQIDKVGQNVLDESSVGIALSQALTNSIAINSSMGASPAILLVIVADAFTDHRELVLQELSWVSVEKIDADTNPQLESLVSVNVSFRDGAPTQDAMASTIVVDVTGYSVPGSTLREQQRAIGDLVSTLKRQSAITDLVVLETPLSRAATQQRISTDTSDALSLFHIRFRLDRSDSDVV